VTTAPFPDPDRVLRARTRPAQVDEDLLELLPTPSGVVAWVRGGDGLVGWGQAARLEVSGPERFRRAEQWWRELQNRIEVHDEVGLPGTGPVVFASMAFADEPGHSVLVVPRVVVGRSGGTTWVTEITVDEESVTSTGPGRRRSPLMQPVQPVRRCETVRYSEGRHPVTAYREAVRRAVDRMRGGELKKVVLAHDLVAVADAPVDPRFLLHNLAARYPSCWAFAVDGLVGATPELLLRRENEAVSSRVLAGTSWPRDGVSTDELARALLSSPKNLEEHEYAVRSLVETLQPLCSELTAPATPHVLRLRNVLHLATDVHGRVADPRTSLFRLAEAVHPTAAVGGTPREDAVRLIRELEGMDRGRYAGPVGWVDGNGDGELGLALRCAQVEGRTVRLFAGCGIVADSDPETEVREAAAKLVPMRDALEGVDRA